MTRDELRRAVLSNTRTLINAVESWVESTMPTHPGIIPKPDNESLLRAWNAYTQHLEYLERVAMFGDEALKDP